MDAEMKKYNCFHALFALISIIIGSLYFRWICYADKITLFAVIFCVYVASFFMLQKKKISKESIVFMLATLVYSIRFLIYDFDIISVLALIVIHICALLFIASTQRSLIDDIIVNTLKASFQAPFISFFSLPVSVVKFITDRGREKTKYEKKQYSENFVFIILGICLSVPVVTIVLILLGTDSFFGNFISEISAFLENITLDFHISRYINIITVFVAFFVFGAIYSADTKKCSEVLVYKVCSIPSMIISTLMVLLFFVYTIFVMSQFDGYICMIMGSLPQNLTFAEFARSGFFELCIVACINGAIVYTANAFSCKDEGARILKIFSLVLVIFTLFLIFTAAAKMIYYICAFGFTPKRFYTLWFMLLLTIIFCLFIPWFKNNEFKISRYSVYVMLLMFLILFFVDFGYISKSLNILFGY